MKARLLALTLAVTLVWTLGCPAPTFDRTGNQGGSTPISLGMKLVSIQQETGSIQNLNADDLQLMADLATEIANLDLPPVSDELAAAGVQLIAANEIQSIDDLIALTQGDPADVVIPDGVEEVVLEELQEMFGVVIDPSVIDQIVARTVPRDAL